MHSPFLTPILLMLCSRSKPDGAGASSTDSGRLPCPVPLHQSCLTLCTDSQTRTTDIESSDLKTSTRPQQHLCREVAAPIKQHIQGMPGWDLPPPPLILPCKGRCSGHSKVEAPWADVCSLLSSKPLLDGDPRAASTLLLLAGLYEYRAGNCCLVKVWLKISPCSAVAFPPKAEGGYLSQDRNFLTPNT